MEVETGMSHGLTHGFIGVSPGSMESIYLTQMGLSADPIDCFLSITDAGLLEVWLLSEGVAGNVFVPNPGFETPKATASLVDNQVDTSTVIINR